MSQEGVLIVGGSMSGLLAAIMLHRRGRKVDVFERVPGALEGRGAGIVAQPGLIARLDMIGIPMRELGVASAQRRILDRDGRVTITGYMPAGVHGLGAGVSAAARCLPGRSLSSRNHLYGL